MLSHLGDVVPRVGIIAGGPEWDVDVDIISIGSRTVVLTTALAIARKYVAIVTKVKECPVVPITPQINISSATAITSVRASLWTPLGSVEVDRPLTSLAAPAIDLYVIDKS